MLLQTGDLGIELGDAIVASGDLIRDPGEKRLHLLPKVPAHDNGELLAGDLTRIQRVPSPGFCVRSHFRSLTVGPLVGW